MTEKVIIIHFFVIRGGLYLGVPRQEQAVDKPAPSRSSEVETYKNASLFGENPRIQAIIDAVSVSMKCTAVLCFSLPTRRENSSNLVRFGSVRFLSGLASA